MPGYAGLRNTGGTHPVRTLNFTYLYGPRIEPVPSAKTLGKTSTKARFPRVKGLFAPVTGLRWPPEGPSARNATKRILDVFARRMTPRSALLAASPTIDCSINRGTSLSAHIAASFVACLARPNGAPRSFHYSRQGTFASPLLAGTGPNCAPSRTGAKAPVFFRPYLANS
jgi:hypothetical protein